jgi:hypothetical protein
MALTQKDGQQTHSTLVPMDGHMHYHLCTHVCTCLLDPQSDYVKRKSAALGLEGSELGATMSRYQEAKTMCSTRTLGPSIEYLVVFLAKIPKKQIKSAALGL